jgi:cobalt-zinc-cadmium efflux system outer membrane protein
MSKWAVRLIWATTLCAGGCVSYGPSIDAVLQPLSSVPLDVSAPDDPVDGSRSSEPKPSGKSDVPGRIEERLKIPADVPGSDAAPIPIPTDPTKRQERSEAIRKFYEQPLPPLPKSVLPTAGSDAKELTLAQLQAIAGDSHPKLRQAAAEVEAASGAVIQAGLYPNPTIGYEGDTIGSGNTAGQQGGFIEQLIKTGGKRKLAQAAAATDWLNARTALRRAQVDLATEVRSAYFSVLVAQESVRVSRALATMTEEMFRLHVDRVTQAKLDAPYEPMQLRVLAMQARALLIQAQNRYTSAWKQLTAAMNQPDMVPAVLAGRPDMPLPAFHYNDALQEALGRHTDLETAKNSILKAQYLVRLAEVTPIPDILTRTVVQKDYSTPPFNTTANVEVGIALPLFDRNQGGRLQSQAQLARAIEEMPRVRNDLTRKLAEAFERYMNSVVLLDYYRKHILPDQVRTYRGILGRYQLEPDRVTLYDVVNAQQVLATTTQNYLAALATAWQAVVDIAAIRQSDDLFGVEPRLDLAPLPSLEK